jgi:hypothetical protein
LLGEVSMEAGHVEGGKHGFAGAGGGHHEISPALVEAAFGDAVFENRLLVGKGAGAEEADREGSCQRDLCGSWRTHGSKISLIPLVLSKFHY